jgi:predicted protein tyrosine phosphatase
MLRIHPVIITFIRGLAPLIAQIERHDRDLACQLRRTRLPRCRLHEPMDIFVYSRSALDAVRPQEVPHVIISITSSPEDVARLRSNDMCRGVLRLSFPDAEVPSTLHAEANLFSQDQARKVWTFVEEHLPEIQRIIVHCDAGVSRSSAVAAALARVLNDDDAEFFGGRYRPNMRVYRSLLETRPLSLP